MEVSGQRRAPAALSPERPAVRIEEGPGRAPGPVWTYLRREKYLAFTGIRTCDCHTRSFVIIFIIVIFIITVISVMEGIDSVPETDHVYRHV
jgi:hypothetical protein